MPIDAVGFGGPVYPTAIRARVVDALGLVRALDRRAVAVREA